MQWSAQSLLIFKAHKPSEKMGGLGRFKPPWSISEALQSAVKQLISSGFFNTLATAQFPMILQLPACVGLSMSQRHCPSILTRFVGPEPTEACSQCSTVAELLCSFFPIILFLFTMALGWIPKKLGIAALNYILPTSHWKEIYINNYCMKHLTIHVDGLEHDTQNFHCLRFLRLAWETWTSKPILCQWLPQACKKVHSFSCTTSWQRRGHWVNWRCSYWWWQRRQPQCLATTTRQIRKWTIKWWRLEMVCLLWLHCKRRKRESSQTWPINQKHYTSTLKKNEPN